MFYLNALVMMWWKKKLLPGHVNIVSAQSGRTSASSSDSFS